MEYIKKNEFAQLKGKVVKITKIYGPYRKGYNNTLERYETVKDGVVYVWKGGKEVADEDTKVDFKLHKKKYDINIELAKPVKIKVQKWDKNAGENYDEEVEDKEFNVKEISASILGDMMSCGVAFGKVPENEEGYRPYDREEEFITELEGTKVKFSTTKEKRQIGDRSGTYDKFTFVAVDLPEKKEDVVEEEEEGLPF